MPLPMMPSDISQYLSQIRKIDMMPPVAQCTTNFGCSLLHVNQHFERRMTTETHLQRTMSSGLGMNAKD
jgi:hypothetical protein